jgi:hypothetical protein
MPTYLKRMLGAVALLFGLLAGLLYWPSPTAAQGTNTYFITDVDSSQFPDITFRLRVVDINNKVVTNLNNSSFTVYDDGQQVTDIQVTPQSDGALNIIYVIDLGRQSSFTTLGLDQTRQAISALVTGGYFVEGRDTVQVLARENLNGDQTIELRSPSTKATDLTDWAGTYTFPRSTNKTKGLLGVESALQSMEVLVPVPGSQASAIIFLSRFIEDPSTTTAVGAAETLAQTARAQFVPVYVFHTDLSRVNDAPLIALGNGSNGAYVAITRNTVASAVAGVYQTINAQRSYFTVSYRSQLSSSGARQITIDSPTPSSNGLPGTYQAQVDPPQVEIIQPVPGSTIRREAKLAEGGAYAYDNNSATVTASIVWPPGIAPRALTLAELYVNGRVEDRVQPVAGAESIEFTWDISNIATPGANPIQLEVRVTDELGVQTSASAEVIIEVIPPPTATAPPPTATPEPDGPEDWLQANWLYIVVPLVCLGLVVVFAIAVFALLRSRRGGGRAPGGSYEAPNTMIVGAPGGGKGQATLTVMEGPSGVVGESYGLVKPITVIGRNPARCDIVFYPNQDSSMSRIHCTIQQNGKFFQLTDNNSSNGTRVNGTVINANEPVQLRDNDEIVLGDLAKLGVKLRFSQRGESAGSDVADRTFIVDDWDKQNFDQYKDG